MELPFSLCVCMGSFQVLELSPTVERHTASEVRLTGHSTFLTGVNVSVNCCFSVSCDTITICSGCTPPFALWQLGEAPAVTAGNAGVFMKWTQLILQLIQKTDKQGEANKGETKLKPKLEKL